MTIDKSNIALRNDAEAGYLNVSGATQISENQYNTMMKAIGEELTRIVSNVVAEGDSLSKLYAITQATSDEISVLQNTVSSTNPTYDTIQKIVNFIVTIDQDSEIVSKINTELGSTSWQSSGGDLSQADISTLAGLNSIVSDETLVGQTDITAQITASSDALKASVPIAGDNLNKLYLLIQSIQTVVASDDLDYDTLQKVVDFIKTVDTGGELLAVINSAVGNANWQDSGGDLSASDINTKAKINAIVTDATLADTDDVTAASDALKGGVPVAGDTLNKLYNLFQSITALQSEDIDTLAEINAIITDADIATQSDIIALIGGSPNDGDTLGKIYSLLTPTEFAAVTLSADLTINSAAGLLDIGGNVNQLKVGEVGRFRLTAPVANTFSVFLTGSDFDPVTTFNFDSGDVLSAGEYMVFFARTTTGVDFSIPKRNTASTTLTLVWNPLNGANDLNVDGNITIDFNKAVALTDGTPINNTNVDALITLTTDSGSTPVPFDATVDVSNPSAPQIIINPTSNLGFTTEYQVSINNYEDASTGEEFTTASSITITTVAAPTNDLTFDLTAPNQPDFSRGFSAVGTVYTGDQSGYLNHMFGLESLGANANGRFYIDLLDLSEDAGVVLSFTTNNTLQSPANNAYIEGEFLVQCRQSDSFYRRGINTPNTDLGVTALNGDKIGLERINSNTIQIVYQRSGVWNVLHTFSTTNSGILYPLICQANVGFKVNNPSYEGGFA